ncbi:Sensor protein SrrB [Rubripirellula lacrimiformis]|uniref:histidine kinase n=1 Tax=Rubripirellula lacrimiformis TaxID=1930273 RepID=A0A517NEK9_9BACT|nr:hybrid sensor histidine kinase/response regulator [Rubripirellula lacrimiformis]QDT05566.1 Sensor protein SrrB [Rubripirellula lacrimiformis]
MMGDRIVRVLVVEDDDLDVTILQVALLRSVGTYQLTHASSLAEAIEASKKSDFDVIFTDLGLPDSIGLNAVEALSMASHSSAIIAMSGQDQEQLYVDAVASGADNFLCKIDLTPTAVHRCIQQSIQRIAQRNEIERLMQTNQAHKEMLEKQSQQLEQQNARLRRLYDSSRDFVNNVSHEFRTPLCVVKQYANLIADGVVGTVHDEQRRMLRVIEDRVDDLNNMVDDMLDISRHESGLLAAKRSRCSPNEVVDRVFPGLQQRASIRDVSLLFAGCDPETAIYCDAEKVSRTLINLIVNAIKFSSAGDTVTITAVVDHANHEVRFSVADQGPGIPADHQEMIFARFEQTHTSLDRSTKGVGLGLNIAKELVDLNLGSMHLTSALGKGSTFAFTVPLDEPDEVAKRFFARAVPGEAMTVFVVEPVEPNAPPEALTEIHQLLNYLIRSRDLLVRQTPSQWTIVLAADEAGCLVFLQRASEDIESINRNRPQGKLPRLQLRRHAGMVVPPPASTSKPRVETEYPVSTFVSDLTTASPECTYAL